MKYHTRLLARVVLKFADRGRNSAIRILQSANEISGDRVHR